MIWAKHYELKDQHAFLSPSSNHWINYDADKLELVYKNKLAAERGTRLHDLASRLIKEKKHMPNDKDPFNQFVNDAIDYGMQSELVLKYSDNAFGTTDAISFENNILRIHDYKSGTIKASMTQLKVYAAFFCLEYGIDPHDLFIELRIYQTSDPMICLPDADEIEQIMEKTVTDDLILEKIKEMEVM